MALAGLEGVLFFASVYLAGLLRFWGDGLSVIHQQIGPVNAPIFVVVMGICMLSLGLYRRYHIADRGGMTSILPRIAIAHLIGLLVMAAVFYILPELHLYRGISIGAVLIAFVLSSVTRLLFMKFADHRIFKRRVLVYGAGENALGIDELTYLQSGRSMFKVVNYVRCNKREGEGNKLKNVIDLPPALLPFCQQHDIDEIVIAPTDRRNNMPVDDLMLCKMNGINVLKAAEFFERETGALRVDMMSPDAFIFADGFKTGTMRSLLKRAFDVGAASLMMPLALLVLPVTVLCIWREDGRDAPILYRQKRIGAGGEPFEILKIRSMKVDDGAAEQFASQDDDRITKVGRVIRKLRIDELPQLFNVLRGDMSFVGPRPEQPTFVKKFAEKIPYYNERHTVKPGITGWAQVKHAYTDDDIPQTTLKLQFDLYYVKNHSLLFDLFILMHTVEIVLMKLGPR